MTLGPIRALTRRFETLFDPAASAKGPPPTEIGPFMRWLLEGTAPAVWLLAAVSLCLGAAEAVAALLMGRVIDLAEGATPAAFFAAHWPEILGIGLFFLLVRPVLMALSAGLVSLSIGPGVFQLGVWRLHKHTLGQSLGFFQDDYAGRISQKELQTANSMTTIATEMLNAIAYGFATVIAAALVLGEADWRLTLLLGLWFAVYVTLVSRFLPTIRARSRARADARSALSGQLVDSISHIETVKLFAHAGREEAAAAGSLERYRAAALAFGRTVFAFRALLALLSGLLPVGLIGAALWLWHTGQTSIGDVAMAGLLATRLSQMSGWISFTAMNIFTDFGVVEDGMRTLSVPHALRDRPDAAAPSARAEGRIAFETVRFAYGRRKGGGLHGISFTVAPGEKVALVGPSGAGKSTAIALLLRLHDVEGGRITVDGHDVRDLQQDWLRRQVATVTQEPALFNRSALDNILYGRPDAGMAAAEDAAEQAAAADFIAELRDPSGRAGYAAHLGERGVKLSGGQRQRIAIARAILKDAPVLVLDEATSALDSEVEAVIQASLAHLIEGRTVLAIAHRLSTIKAMDRIVVLDQGRIVEEGPHAALLDAGGLYARLWARQSGGLIDTRPDASPDARSATAAE